MTNPWPKARKNLNSQIHFFPGLRLRGCQIKRILESIHFVLILKMQCSALKCRFASKKGRLCSDKSIRNLTVLCRFMTTVISVRCSADNIVTPFDNQKCIGYHSSWGKHRRQLSNFTKIDRNTNEYNKLKKELKSLSKFLQTIV